VLEEFKSYYLPCYVMRSILRLILIRIVLF